MTAVVGIVGNDRRVPRGQILLWSSAALAAFALHAGLAAWMMHGPPALPAEATAPAAVMIELAAAPEAPVAPDQQIATDATDAPEVAPPPPELLQPQVSAALMMPGSPPVELPMHLSSPDAISPPTPQIMPEIEAQSPPPTPETATARPMARPENLSRPVQSAKRAETKPNPTPVREQPSKAATRARVQAPPAQTPAAAETSTGASGAASPAKWQSRLMAHLERRKRYPAGARQRREEGVAYVRFAIDGQGRVLSAAISRSSGSADLDQEVLALVRRASPVPAPPPGAPHDITAPVQFRIR